MTEERIERKGLIDMTVGSPMRHIIKFSLPLLIGNVFQQLYNLVDSSVLGKFVGTQALAAAITSAPIVFLMVSLFNGFGLGSSILISQFYGRGDEKSIQKAVKTAYTVVLICAIPVTVITVALAATMLRALNVPDDMFDQAHIYLVITFIGTTGVFGYNANAGILQGQGDSKTPLYFLIVSTVMNIILDFALVFPFGIAGVAAATAIAQFTSWIIGIFYIRKKYPHLQLNPLKPGIDKKILKLILKLGLPAGVQQALIATGMLLFMRLVNSFGSTFVAGYGAGSRIDTFAFLPLMSFSAALTSFVGQNIGAGKIDRVKKGYHSAIVISVITCAVICALLLPFSKFLIGLFDDNPEVLKVGSAYLFKILPAYPLGAVLFMTVAVLRGSGASMLPMFISLLGILVFRIPTAYFIASRWGEYNIFYSFAIGWFFAASLALFFYFRGTWKTKGVSI